MGINYVPYGSVRVSERWRSVLGAADDAKVRFHVTSGHRTLAEQSALFQQNMVRPGVPKPGRPLTAVPNRNAPHIREGRHAHALDVNALDGGETRLQRWLEKQGAHPTNPVPGEAWHIELTGQELQRLAQKIKTADRRKAQAAKRRKARAKKRAAEKRALARTRRRRTSKRGIALIREFEGCELEPYNDPAGFATVGIGHLIARRPVNQADRDRYRGFSRVDAEKLLAQDLGPFEKAVRRSAMPLTQPQFDALVSACFNLGAGVLDKGRSLGDALRAKNARRVADALLLYDKAGSPPRALPGLTRRRKAERALFLDK